MPSTLGSAVGPGLPNHPADVRVVQRLLNVKGVLSGARLHETGMFDAATAAAILKFQYRVLRVPLPNGSVRRGDETWWRLAQMGPRRLVAGAEDCLPLVPHTGPAQFQDDDFKAAAAALGCEVRAIKAVTAVESPEGPFDASGRPPILFERHYFSRLTLRRYDALYPTISNVVCGGYWFPEPDQYVRLQRAFALDAAAALKSSSWGAFQLMGDNHAAAGHATVETFVRAVCQSARLQMDAFVAFLQHDPILLPAIQKKDWTAFAQRYNGPAYAKNRYDTKLAAAYGRATA